MKSKVIGNISKIEHPIANSILNKMRDSFVKDLFKYLSEGRTYSPEYPIAVTHPAPDLSEQMEIIGVLTGKQMKEQNLFPNNELEDDVVYVYGREWLPYDMSESMEYDSPVNAADLYIEELLFILEQGFLNENKESYKG